MADEEEREEVDSRAEEVPRCGAQRDDALAQCGRAIYEAPEGADKEPVCLMHSRDPNKSDVEFQREFERILEECGQGVADFTEFVFPSLFSLDREFKARCIFRLATFMGQVWLQNCVFAQVADFYSAEFTQRADFAGATFTQGASFLEARFSGETVFGGAKFCQKAHFSGAEFTKWVDFTGATFEEGVEFRATVFRKDKSCEPGPVFSQARFEKPGAVVFYDTYLGQALFHNCDVSRVVFSAVRWRTRDNNRKRMVFEEEFRLEIPDPEYGVVNNIQMWSLELLGGSADERNYGVIAELYRQLKKNYDTKCEYGTAGDFHYGEMEMKRLETPLAGALLRGMETRKMQHAARLVWRAKQVWHQHFGVAAWYKRMSEYGESYTRPLVWLASAVLVFAIFYPFVGLRYNGPQAQLAVEAVKPGQADAPSPALRWRSPCPDSSSYHTCMGLARMAGNGLLTSIEVAAFQRELAYEPVYPWGRLARLVELTLTSTLLALLLLALRRQFRR